MNITRTLILCFVMIPLSVIPLDAQERVERPNGQVELFAGVDVRYSDITLNNRIFDFLINVSPSVKWHPWKGAVVTGQVFVPIVNHYGSDHDYIHFNIADVSQEWKLNDWSLKASAGLFSNNRFGLDGKFEWRATDWLAFEGEAGLTGYYYMTDKWEFSEMQRVTGQLMVKLYLKQWNTEFRLSGGRYNYEDYGVRAEGFVHFSNFLTAGVFVQAGNKYGSSDGSMKRYGGGAKLVFMLPWQGRKDKKLRVRPASNFRITYENNADQFGMQTYHTDPEENEREGNFETSDWGFPSDTDPEVDSSANNEWRKSYEDM